MKIKGTCGSLVLSFMHLVCGSRAPKGFAHLLLGRLVLEAGVLEVVSTHGLVFVIGGAQELYRFLDGHCTAVYLIATYSVLKRNIALVECSAKRAVSILGIIRKESNTKCKILSHCHINHLVHPCLKKKDIIKVEKIQWRTLSLKSYGSSLSRNKGDSK